MILSEIMERLEAFCPASFAQSWDNVGLQTGRTASDISTVCLCVDATS
ncbi:MAG: Nif3-like dinuclear metal center hexameric protein, partial [Lachnospiraceae bacterium]|nr:Nif3-like dinuclear metal center hexameric protein [Lachnospiraceae bacterium]